jgi:hypothetical protein
MRWSVRLLRCGVGLLEGHWLLDRRGVDICDDMLGVAVALDAEDNEQDPSSELEYGSNHKHSNTVIEFACAKTNMVSLSYVVNIRQSLKIT